MYGIDEKTWKHIVENIDFPEVFVKSKGGQERSKNRQALWEKKGHEVIPYEDKWIDKNGETRWVSVGIFVLKKEKKDAE